MQNNKHKKIKLPVHVKIKNTGILFEALTRQITRDILNKKNTSEAIKIIKKYFKENTELRKELNLYKYILETKFKNEVKASNYLDIILDFRKNINNLKLKKEKYNIIKEIKETYTIDEFFSWRIKEYPIYASIYKLFEYRNLDLNNKTVINSLLNEKFNAINFMLTNLPNKKYTPTKIDKLYNKQNNDIKKLSYKIIIEKFNNKYGSVLTEKQKELVKQYINNLSNTKSLQKYTISIIPNIIKNIKELKEKIDDKIIIIKLSELINQINKIKKINIIEDKHIVGLLKTYELIDEINKHVSACNKEKNSVEVL